MINVWLIKGKDDSSRLHAEGETGVQKISRMDVVTCQAHDETVTGASHQNAIWREKG